MLLSRNSNDKTPEYYAILKKAGWQAIDINETCDPSKFYNVSEGLGYVRGVIETIKNAGLEIGQCHAPMAEWYAGKTKEELESRMQCIVNCAHVAGRSGIPCTIVHPFIYSWAEDKSPEYTFEMNVKHLKEVCAAAGDGTKVCLENLPGCNGFIKTPEDMKKMLDAVGEDLYVCIDTGHAFSNKLKISPFFELLGDKIKALHVHDSLGGMDRHMLPYLGAGDWNDFKESLKKYNYAGTLNSEANFAVYLPRENMLEWETYERKVFETLL